ncbi:MAG: cytochrome C oxidase subunit IV family protein [Planctomycetes bacterium]|nr:cytochrome C oxidase subunit IV family protein [Planctomycetota bacterium]
MTQFSHPHDHDQQARHDSQEHIDHGGIGKYLIVFAALCVLTGASFFTYSSYWPFGKHVAWAFMVAVSCTKAMLVIMFFMHLLWEANWKWVLTIPATFMSIFLTLMLVPDIGWRQNNGFARYSYERLLYAPDPPAIEHAEAEAAEEEMSHDSPH